MKVIDIGDNQTVTFFEKSIRDAKSTALKSVSDKLMMVRIKEQITHVQTSTYTYAYICTGASSPKGTDARDNKCARGVTMHARQGKDSNHRPS